MKKFNYEKNMIKSCAAWEKLEELKNIVGDRTEAKHGKNYLSSCYSLEDKSLIDAEYKKWFKNFNNYELELGVIFITQLFKNIEQDEEDLFYDFVYIQMKETLKSSKNIINNSNMSVIDFMNNQGWNTKNITHEMRATDRKNKLDKKFNQLEVIFILIDSILENETIIKTFEFLDELERLEKNYKKYRMPIPHFLLKYFR
jgi:hypothetical protein